jgi:hypothetical protein
MEKVYKYKNKKIYKMYKIFNNMKYRNIYKMHEIDKKDMSEKLEKRIK